MALRLRAFGRLLSVGRQPGASVARDDAAGAFLTSGKRSASPQPVEVEEAAASLRPPLEAQPAASTSGRALIGQSARERLIYMLYKVRGEAIQQHVANKNKRYQQHVENDDLLLPLRVLMMRQGGPRSKDAWPKYHQELGIEMDALRRMQKQVAGALKGQIQRGQGVEFVSSQSIMAAWAEPLTRAIEDEQRAILNTVPHVDRRVYGPHLLLLPAHVLANATLHGFINSILCSERLGVVTVPQPCIQIGKNVQQQVGMDMMKAKAKRISNQRKALLRKLREGDEALQGKEWSLQWFEKWRKSLQQDSNLGNLDDVVVREELMKRLKELRPYELPDPADEDPALPLGSSLVTPLGKATRGDDGARLEVLHGPKAQLDAAIRRMAERSDRDKLYRINTFINRARRASKKWDQSATLKVGARLLDLMIQSCYVETIDPVTKERKREPALTHYTVYSGVLKQGRVKLDDRITRRLAAVKDIKGLMLPAYQPMVIPPMPWQGLDFGGYLLTRTYLMRNRGFRLQNQALRKVERDGPGLQLVYDALNAMGETGWRINRDMFAVVQHAWKNNMDICDIPMAKETPVVRAPTMRRFRTMSGGFWEHPEPTGATFDPARSSRLHSIQEWEDAVQAWRAAGSNADERPALRLPDQTQDGDIGDAPQWDAQESDLSILVGDGDAMSAGRRRMRGRFRRTQLLVTMTAFETETEHKARRLVNAQIRKANRERYSMRCDLKYKLDVAHRFLNERVIYFPHNIDFRGRAYPMHPHLNHLGNDVCRGLLEFAEAKQLGAEGLDWLYVQIANSWGQGIDKLSFEQRRQFVQDHLEDVRASARQPFESTWWQSADAPFQCLAACKDVDRALACDNPANYLSHTPVMMDGSCNGLQHYAALSRDRPGGRAVNLLPFDKPQDVYTEVAGLVKEEVRRAVEKGGIGADKADMLLDQIDRKLVKQTVMTSVYGVTFVGARSQIKRRLKERGWEPPPGSNIDIFLLAHYAAQQTLAGLNMRFSEARLVMEWLTKCAAAIANSGKPVAWTSPLGLPVVQPYREQKKLAVITTLQKVVLKKDWVSAEPIVKTRQRTAFPPNFIHSIDSSHMMMTAIACKQAGVTFAGVHDSFWTHAATVPQLNRILREKFVELYKRPILEELERELKARYPEVEFPPMPEKGDLDIEEVLNAEYFFS